MKLRPWPLVRVNEVANATGNSAKMDSEALDVAPADDRCANREYDCSRDWHRYRVAEVASNGPEPPSAGTRRGSHEPAVAAGTGFDRTGASRLDRSPAVSTR